MKILKFLINLFKKPKNQVDVEFDDDIFREFLALPEIRKASFKVISND